jgi:hypothetical protein
VGAAAAAAAAAAQGIAAAACSDVVDGEEVADDVVPVIADSTTLGESPSRSRGDSEEVDEAPQSDGEKKVEEKEGVRNGLDMKLTAAAGFGAVRLPIGRIPGAGDVGVDGSKHGCARGE